MNYAKNILIILLCFSLQGYVNANLEANPGCETSISTFLNKSANLLYTSEQTFTEVAYSIKDFFAPKLANMDIHLEFDAIWDVPEAGAFVQRNQQMVYIEIYGGIAQHPNQSTDSFAISIIHEFSHVLGGPPYLPKKQLSAEGQADYVAGKYLKEILPRIPENPTPIPTISNLPPELKKYHHKCLAASVDSQLCLRGLQAIQQFGDFIAQINQTAPPKIGNEDTKVVEKTILSYPSVQCRLDTVLAGFLDLPRPSCWF
ncbi:MAG: hypothetical protein ISR65_04210 [Bacteriovoracaceae bacterium]|nr:hypothetical protein [Bacteriovoracaceae bacterium]